jgi:hypothetical protein
MDNKPIEKNGQKTGNLTKTEQQKTAINFFMLQFLITFAVYF